jgi:hypothetical protein
LSLAVDESVYAILLLACGSVARHRPSRIGPGEEVPAESFEGFIRQIVKREVRKQGPREVFDIRLIFAGELELLLFQEKYLTQQRDLRLSRPRHASLPTADSLLTHAHSPREL